MIRFEYLVMGQRMTPETASTPAIADRMRQLEADFRNKLEGVVPPNSPEGLVIRIRWENANTFDWNLQGPKALVEAAGKRLQG